jgi:hypothetical protein
LVFGIVIDGLESGIDLFLGDTFLAKLACDDALRDFLMIVARSSPGKCKLLVINEASLL